MQGIFELYVETSFAAAHRLCGYPGDCARVHGHNWVVEVHVRCLALNETGMGVDFRDIKAALDAVVSTMDHRDLNDLPAFRDANPTAENIARHLYRELSKIIDTEAVKVSRIKVCESPGAGVYYWEE